MFCSKAGRLCVFKTPGVRGTAAGKPTLTPARAEFESRYQRIGLTRATALNYMIEITKILRLAQSPNGCQKIVKDNNIIRGFGGTVATESALRSAGTFCRGFEPRHRRPGLMEGPKA
ncbi:hypothetical protein PoB_005742700 [Plakobranchus ocellatus]|uniref:Uncharacterized protein n=1 Tax=Plakobranchus ocellatus TaxID=259542 RepID=A0AAV4CHL6_9GAST|nr:hypothetical protein PoB_005742700 [Plakobranchus ocellatus]